VLTGRGTGTEAALGAWTAAGKTGTARKPNPHGRGYLSGAYVASFIGFAPAEHPAVAVAVVLDQPTPIFGGVVAAPVFREVASYALTRLRVPASVPAHRQR
jgi:cell division protein FtsI (penicillin-binding protein 3)